jgi:uncharacterized protein DUF4253
MFDRLPSELTDVLPPGRFLPDGSPTMWQSDEAVADVLDLWDRCERSAVATGVWPVVSGLFGYGPIYPQRLRKPADIGAVDLESELEATWRALRASQATGFDPTGYPEDLDDVEELIESERERWEHGWPPYEEWPGLAPAAPGSGPDAAEVHRQVLTHILEVHRQVLTHIPEVHRQVLTHIRRARGGLGGGYLALVRAGRPADIPAVMAWDAEAPHEFLSALLRSWDDRFGARVVGFEGATIHVSVARPPATAAHASLVAMEHMLLGDDNHPPGGLNFADYAESLVGERHWFFWWD